VCTDSGAYTYTYIGDQNKTAHTGISDAWPKAGHYHGKPTYTKSSDRCYVGDGAWKRVAVEKKKPSAAPAAPQVPPEAVAVLTAAAAAAAANAPKDAAQAEHALGGILSALNKGKL
jgi:hypothetical protein